MMSWWRVTWMCVSPRCPGERADCPPLFSPFLQDLSWCPLTHLFPEERCGHLERWAKILDQTFAEPWRTYSPAPGLPDTSTHVMPLPPSQIQRAGQSRCFLVLSCADRIIPKGDASLKSLLPPISMPASECCLILVPRPQLPGLIVSQLLWEGLEPTAFCGP